MTRHFKQHRMVWVSDHIEDTRLRIIEAASDLFWAHGYERTTLSQIQQAAGVHGGSLYHFFRSKKEVARAVVRSYRDRLEPELIEPTFARFDDPIERIFGLLDGYRQLLLRTRYARGCPIGALALELVDCDEEIREGLVENFEGWREMVEQCLREAAPGLVPDADPEDLSRLVLTVMEGSVLQARAYRDLRAFDASVSQLRSFIERLRR